MVCNTCGYSDPAGAAGTLCPGCGLVEDYFDAAKPSADAELVAAALRRIASALEALAAVMPVVLAGPS